MGNFIHEIFEAWLLTSTQEPLDFLRGALLRSHLRSCARCRSFALDLVEFSHSLEVPAVAKLSASESAEVHLGLMAAFQRERFREKVLSPLERATGPLVRPVLWKGLAAATLLWSLSLFFRPVSEENFEPQAGPGQADMVRVPTSEPSFTPSPTATAAIQTSPSPEALSATATSSENRQTRH
jgi:hypothetical protein